MNHINRFYGLWPGCFVVKQDVDDVFNIILKYITGAKSHLNFSKPTGKDSNHWTWIEQWHYKISHFFTSIFNFGEVSQDSTILTYVVKNLMNPVIKMINHVLNHFISNDNSYNLLDIRIEALQYSLDLLENIALFITNNKANNTESEGTINILFKNILTIYDEFYHSLDSKILILY